MNRFFLELSFKGTHYHGWQSQPNASTVQSTLESAINTLTGEHIQTTGAGRTDSGVHARFFTAHLDSSHSIFAKPENFLYKINSILPDDISVHRLLAVPEEAHARFSALSRTYEYTISQEKDPFDIEFSWYFPRKLNMEAMNQATAGLIEINDFTSFSKLHTDVRTNNCKIIAAAWNQKGSKIIFTIQADRFLRNMVRSLVGTLVDVGLCKINQEEFADIAAGRNRCLAGFSVPAHGLSLIDISYPFAIRL